jgi:hypothetical protein
MPASWRRIALAKKRARFTAGHEPRHLLRGLPESEGAESLCHAFAGLIDRIEAERKFAPHESALCNWCPYWDLCPVRKHLVKVKGLPRDRIKAYVSTEKRCTVILKEDS